MQRVLVLHSSNGPIVAAARSLAKALEARGAWVQLLSATQAGSNLNMLNYDLICVGSAVEGFLGGKIAADIRQVIPLCKHMGGKRVVAFVTPKLFGTEKALRVLMELLEHEGANVFDFCAIRRSEDAERLASRV